MIDERFVILGVLINLCGTLIYLFKTTKGTVQPNRVTWFFWALAPLIAFFAELRQGVGLVALTTFAVGFGPLCIFVASFFNKKAYWRLSKFDYYCGAFAALGLLLWLYTKSGNYAIFFAILADIAAAVPTAKKAWFYPESEDYAIFALSLINSGIAILTFKEWSFANIAFPIYIFLMCLFFVVLIKFKLGKRIMGKI